MKYFYIFLIAFVSFGCFGQIAEFNSFPSLRPSHILDEKLNDISFAYSMRMLVSNYNGPLVRLRRSSDNAQKDFYHADNDIVDIKSIDAWRSGSDVFIVKWYDQSGLGRHANQPASSRQPQFVPDPARPYFKCDGSNDFLEVPASIQVVTNHGANGTVLAILAASKKYQFTFGVVSGSNRWAAHINWTNNFLYFDPGVCCNNPRRFYNASNEGVLNHYVFVRETNKVIARTHGVEKINGNYNRSNCTVNLNFTLGHANGAGMFSTASFSEFIMYHMDIPVATYLEIEKNAITFWSL